MALYAMDKTREVTLPVTCKDVGNKGEITAYQRLSVK